MILTMCRIAKRSKNLRLASTQARLTESDVEEIRIPVPWGHVAGKWWGSRSRRPVVCLHGWLDNAGSFDPLIPVLPARHSYLALDLPGHGLSSKLPNGSMYLLNDQVAFLRRVHKYFGWEHMSLLSHSLGSMLSYLYAIFYPSQVDFYVGLDAMKPRSYDLVNRHKLAPKSIDSIIKYDALDERLAPSYLPQDLMARWVKDTDNSLTEESCRILMKRGTENMDGRVKLTRDVKLKSNTLYGLDHVGNLRLARRINCSVLIIKATRNSYYDTPEQFYQVLDVVKTKAKYCEYHKVEGTHHVHMNNPELIAPIITNFFDNIGA